MIRVRFHPSVTPPPELDPFPGGILARLVAQESGSERGEMHCILTSDAEVAELNRRFRGIEAPTDVLAFPYDPNATEGSLGDIYVSLDRASEQATERGEPVGREVWRLFVHGALHLTGHEHETPEGEREMTRVQEEYVSLLPASR